jgi:hypothetical protein
MRGTEKQRTCVKVDETNKYKFFSFKMKKIKYEIFYGERKYR